MANLNFREKRYFENLFNMGDGYVLDFNNRTFEEFILDSIGIQIYDVKYESRGTSKANRLRAFCDTEPDYKVGILLEHLTKYWLDQVQMNALQYDRSDEMLYEQCIALIARLKSGNPIDDLDAITPNREDRNFHLLAESIKKSIHNGEPEIALDRLHTFVVKYMRELCNKHEVNYRSEYALHSLMGMYVKAIKKKQLIESAMAERILKSSISLLEAFNDVRNNQSFAHDNPILNPTESVFIFNSISNVIRFIEIIENPTSSDIDTDKIKEKDDPCDELPF